MLNKPTPLRFLPLRQAFQSSALSQVLILLLALGLRLWGLGDGLLWIDEAMEYWVATSSLPSLLSNVRLAIQDPPFYSFLLHFWLLPDQSEAYLRLPSVLFSLLSVWAVMRIAGYAARWFPSTGHPADEPSSSERAVMGQRAALLAGLLMAVLPAQVRYAQEVGQYAPMSALLAISLFALQLASRPAREAATTGHRGWRSTVAWLASALLAVYTYYGALLATAVPLFCELLLAAVRRDWQVLKRLGAAALAFLLALLPLLVFFLPAQLRRGPTTAALQNTDLSIPDLFNTLTVSSARMLAFQLTADPYTILRTWYPAIAALLLLGLAIIHLRAARRMQVLVWFISTWLVCVLAAQFNLYPFGFRYSLILTPVLVPLLALGLDYLFQHRWLRWAGACLTILLVAIALISQPHPAVRQLVAPQARWGWPENNYAIHPGLDFWRSNRAAGEYTYIYYASVPTFHYYLHLDNLDSASPAGPFYIACWEDTNAPECHFNAASPNPAKIIDGTFFRNQTPEEQYAIIQAALPANASTFWIFFSSVYGNERLNILNQFQQDYQIVQQFESESIWIYKFQANP